MARQALVSQLRLFTPQFRVSYPYLFEPYVGQGQEPKYRVSGIIPKKLVGKQAELFNAIKAELKRIAIEFHGEQVFYSLMKSGQFKWPIIDGANFAGQEGYGPDKWVFKMSAKRMPGVIGRDLRPLRPADVYPGCYGQASVTLYAFDNVSKGVHIGLNNFQKQGDGAQLGGGVAADKEFSVVKDEDWVDYTTTTESDSSASINTDDIPDELRDLLS